MEEKEERQEAAKRLKTERDEKRRLEEAKRISKALPNLPDLHPP